MSQADTQNEVAPSKAQFRFDRVRINHFQYDYPDDAEKRKGDSRFQVSVGIGADPEAEIMGILVEVHMWLGNDASGGTAPPNEKPHVSCTTEVMFKFRNMHVLVNEHVVEIPSEQLIATVSLAISTVRGILVERLRGTPFSPSILPVVDPTMFVAEADESGIVRINLSSSADSED